MEFTEQQREVIRLEEIRLHSLTGQCVNLERIFNSFSYVCELSAIRLDTIARKLGGVEFGNMQEKRKPIKTAYWRGRRSTVRYENIVYGRT